MNSNQQISRNDNSLKWVMLSHFYRPQIMNDLLRLAEQTGFGQATFVDGRPRDHVQTVFLERNDQYPLGPIFDRIIHAAEIASQLFGIEVYAKKLATIQIARYLPGDHYGVHVDHDSGLENLEYDRKLSFFCSITHSGQLYVDKETLNVGLGDALIFPANMDHAAPRQEAGTRYSFVAWIPGPPWR